MCVVVHACVAYMHILYIICSVCMCTQVYVGGGGGGDLV